MQHPLINIPELANLEAGIGLVRIPHEQDVPFTPRVRAVVDTAEFRRLAHISQLGLAALIYPGATHTRFEHALGVFHNALRYLWQLTQDSRSREIIDRHTAELLLVSALLHDVGHWPFCHPIEDLHLSGMPQHEAFAAEFLSSESELSQVLRAQWGVEPEEVLSVLTGPAQDPPRGDSSGLRLIRSILSGPIDVDKMDYLDRDSLHAGVPYGRNFDKNRLIRSLVINEAGDGLAISSKGRTAAELMVFARYVMFSEVYWHHAVRSATSMLARGFYELYRELDLQSLFRTRETELIQVLRASAAGTDIEPLMEGIFGSKRLLYKRAAEYSWFQAPQLYVKLARQSYPFLVRCSAQLARRLGGELKQELRSTDIVIDAPPPHREVEFHVDIYFPKEHVYRPLKQVSPVVEALAQAQFDESVKRVRVFVHPRLVPVLKRISNFDEILQAAIMDTHTDKFQRR